MARTPSKKPRTASKPRSKANNPTTRILTLLSKLRGLAISLSLIGAVSFTPSSLIQKLPENAQQAVSITVDIRNLLVKIAGDTGKSLGGLIGKGGISLPSMPGLPDISDVLPRPEDQSPNTLPKVAGSFSSAKSLLYSKIYPDHRVTFYCGCSYNAKKAVALNTCGLQSLAGINRARRIEAEHVFPAAQFGNFRKCWREPASFPECKKSNGQHLSGRDCCQRVDPVFEAAHNDLFNLYPAVGQINGQRSNYNWGMVSGGERFGDCEIRIDASIRRVQPPAAVRGDIARTMFYMSDTYGFRLSRQDTQLYKAWNNEDPVDAWEIERDRRIKAIQGLGNRYIEAYKRL